jgi:radical SAM protein with 4Fe4S-binding SPASM domain
MYFESLSFFLLKEMGLVEGKTIAVDSFKIRAQNSLKNNFNIAKIKRHKEYIYNRIAEFKRDLDEAQNQEEKAELRQKIETQKKRKAKYESIETQLIESEQEQISLTDSDARAVILHRNIVQVGYTIQAAVDAKNKLITNLETGQVNDTRALAPIALDTKNLLNVEQIDILADKGYHTGDQLQQCADANIQTFVSPKDSSSSDDDIFPISRFIYNPDTDIYTCPAGQQLRTNNIWYKHSSKGRSPAFRFKRYVTPNCKDCPMRSRCTKGKQNGRAIDRSEYADVIAQNAARVNKSPDYYRLRQQLAEHPWGTMKRQWGFDHVLVWGKKQVLGEVSLIFTCYNMIRCIKILGHQGFNEILAKARKQTKNDSKQPYLGKIVPLYAKNNLKPAA